MEHFGFVRDGSVVEFPNSAYLYMKVCDRNGNGGIVCLATGEYFNRQQLIADGLGEFCKVVASDIEKYIVMTEEDEDEYEN